MLEDRMTVMGDVADALEVGTESIEMENELLPVRVMGYDSEFNVAFTIVTTIVSFFVYVGSVVFSDTE